jgi:hypothetical protein
MNNDRSALGKASLWTAIIGIVLPASLAVLVAVFLTRPVLGQDPGIAYALCGVIFVILQLVALGCGIAARRTPTGRAGMVISAILLVLGVGLAAFKLGVSVSSKQPNAPARDGAVGRASGLRP